MLEVVGPEGQGVQALYFFDFERAYLSHLGLGQVGFEMLLELGERRQSRVATSTAEYSQMKSTVQDLARLG